MSSRIYARSTHTAALLLSPASVREFGVGPAKFYASKGLFTLVSNKDVDSTDMGAWGVILSDCGHSNAVDAEIRKFAAQWAKLTRSSSEKSSVLAARLFCSAVKMSGITIADTKKIKNNAESETKSSSDSDSGSEGDSDSYPQWLVAAAGLHSSLLSYSRSNSSVANDDSENFGKRTFPFADTYSPYAINGDASAPSEWAVAIVTPSLHYTMGGIMIDTNARALRAPSVTGASRHALEPIKGLFACGEASGGLHGRNRLGGNSLAECVVFGRRAGATAAKDVMSPSS